MVILHFASIDDSKTNGVCVVVPLHVRAQGQFAETALVNINNFEISFQGKQLPFQTPFDIRKLPAPFDRPDLVLFHECYCPRYLAVARNLRKNRIPYVIIPHGELQLEAQKRKHFKKAVANLLLFNRFIDHASAIQCLSENERKATRFGKNKILGTNGIDIPSRSKTSFSSEGTIFLYIGRYEWRMKGIDLMLDAIKLQEHFLRENRCRFILHGPDFEGRFAAVSAMVREREISDLVSLNLAILGEDKIKALLDADIFIQTSRYEGMPMGILEAMSYALPCLVTEGTFLGKEVADAQAGWAAETTAPAIAERIVEAVKDRSRWMQFGMNGRRAVQESFSWDTVAEKTVKLYAELLSSMSRS